MLFADPIFLVVLLLLAGYGWLRWRQRRRPPEERIAFPALPFVRSPRATARVRWRNLPAILRVAGLALVVLALARPQTPHTVEEIHSKARNVMVALDISSSMKAKDFQPGNRLTVAREVLSEFVRQRDDDLIGLVIFARRAFLQAPLTPDIDLLGEMIGRVEIGMLPDGTAIGTALAMSLGQLKDLPAKSSVVVLITDGANNTGQPTPLAAAEVARALGIRIHAIGLSTADTTGPDNAFIWRWGRQADRLTSSDEAVLKRLTGRTGGKYFRATDPEALQRIMDEIDPLERNDVIIAETRDYRELYHFALLPGLAFLSLELLLGLTWLRRLP